MKTFHLLCLLILGLLTGCTQNKPEAKRTPILEVEGKFLYKDDLEKVIPASANKIDSAEIADRYIRKWVTDVLMYENGKRNVKDKEAIEAQVEEYRRALTIHQYEQALILERVPTDISEEEMTAFYHQYSPELALKENLIKGVLLILPKNAPHIDQVREWVRTPNEKSLENIEKYSLKSAISFDYINKWTPLGEVLKKAPFKLEDSRDFVARKPFAETSDSTKVYFLRVTDAVLAGQTEPLELAREKIKNIMLNKKQSDFIIQFEKDIYNDAVKNGAINFINQ